MNDWKKQQRADFETSLTEFFKPIEITPDFTPGRLNPANYEDAVVSAHWQGYQAGQDDLVGKIQDAFAAIPFPDGHSADSRAHWKAGVKAAIDAVNRALGVSD
jgi:hypothetical protein